MKYTILITQQCNLRCGYCYIVRKPTKISRRVSKDIIDFIFKHTPPNEKIHIGFFGGEPLLEFELIKSITDQIEGHPSYGDYAVELTVVTNGTIFSDDIADFMNAHNIGLGISCDGPPSVQDVFRLFPNGKGTSAIVENTIRRALERFSLVLVNAVYHPRTFRFLPETVAYLSSLGVKQIYLSPDFSAPWTKEDADVLPDVYNQLAEQYITFYRQRNPHFISLIDSKITVILRGGYDPFERCRMGVGQFAFTPNGNIYPCERLVESGENGHCLGNIYDGLLASPVSCHVASGEANAECLRCGLKEYCMHWCGCSNYSASGYYNRVSPFLCASERAAIQAAYYAYQTLEDEIGVFFYDHMAGLPLLNSSLI
jgi:uncharacterized protein